MTNDIKNMHDLRKFLADELKRVAKEETKPAAAHAVANIAGKILNSIKLELEYHKMIGTPTVIDFINKENTAPLIEEKK